MEAKEIIFISSLPSKPWFRSFSSPGKPWFSSSAPVETSVSAYTSGRDRIYIRPWSSSRQAIIVFMSGRTCLHVRPCCLTTQGTSKETSGCSSRYICIYRLTTQGASKGRTWFSFLHQTSSLFSDRPCSSIMSCRLPPRFRLFPAARPAFARISSWSSYETSANPLQNSCKSSTNFPISFAFP